MSHTTLVTITIQTMTPITTPYTMSNSVLVDLVDTLMAAANSGVELVVSGK